MDDVECASMEKVSIPGPTLASLLQRFASAAGDLDGLLFGRVSPLPPPEPTDDSPAPVSSSSAPVAATVTGFISPASFLDPLGRADPSPLLRSVATPPGSAPLGWFSARRRSPLRPSMRELAVSLSLHRSLNRPHPILFLLLSSPAASGAVHTHEYRAFTLQGGEGRPLMPRSVHVVNVGPAFRAQYSSFSPELAAFPWVPRGPRWEESSSEGRGVDVQMMDTDAVVDGFEMENLSQLAGPRLEEQTKGMENVYGNMLGRLQELARLVEESSARVLEQENRNHKLRSKLAGIE